MPQASNMKQESKQDDFSFRKMKNENRKQTLPESEMQNNQEEPLFRVQQENF